MDVNKRVLQRLVPLRDLINGAHQGPVGYRRDTWARWLSERALDELGPKLAHEIARADLRAMSRKAGSGADLRRLFVAVMIWGSGTTNGRARYTATAIDSPRSGPALAGIAELVRTDQLAEAYRAARSGGRFHLRGVGESFFTKWFWVNASNRRGRRALILDARVWASLGALGWNSIEAAGTRHRPLRYEAYVDAMHYWANELELKADKSASGAERLEIFLFQRNGAIPPPG